MTAIEPNAVQLPDADHSAEADGTTRGGPVAEPPVPDVRISEPAAPATHTELGDRGTQLTTEDVLQQINGQQVAEAEAIRPAPAVPPTALPFRAASGRYRSQAVGFQLELRVDVDGRHPLRRLSGDYFTASSTTTTYFGSWTVDAVTITTTASDIVILGTARTTWSTTFTVATVTIPRAKLFQPAPSATVRWSTPSGAIGASYVCKWVAGAFRTVELEQDCESGVTPFVSYSTGSLPSGGPARTLSIAGSYAEAGIRMLDTGAGNTIATPSNHVWNNASLHDAMQRHFSRYTGTQQFKVWLLHAQRHEFTTSTSTLLGIMFDQQGPPRQGCATFYERVAEPMAANERSQLHTNVHELGHCLNLFHSFHKNRMDPPLPNRPGSLSWMNYPQNYAPRDGAPSGEAAFWTAFPFQFDDLELAHLRHGFRDTVIMGGNPFGKGAAMTAGDEPVSDTTGLRLHIEATQRHPALGTPVVLKINVITDRPQHINGRDHLHPAYGFVQIAITRPRGDVILHRPPVQACVQSQAVLGGTGEEFPISAYLGYDAAVGHIFEDPGTYRIRASYATPEGSVVMSNIATIRVTAPQTSSDYEVADLLLDEQAGMALTLLGSDSPYLADGTSALETVAIEHSEHPAAVYAQFALGMNAARPFASVEDDGSVSVRARDLDRADQLLRPAIDMSRGDAGLDDLTMYQAEAYLADSHRVEGDAGIARELRDDVVQLAQSKNEPGSVVRSLRA